MLTDMRDACGELAAIPSRGWGRRMAGQLAITALPFPLPTLPPACPRRKIVASYTGPVSSVAAVVLAASPVDRTRSKQQGTAILTIRAALLPKATACSPSAWGSRSAGLPGWRVAGGKVWHLHQADTKSWLVCSWEWEESRAGWDLLVF